MYCSNCGEYYDKGDGDDDGCCPHCGGIASSSYYSSPTYYSRPNYSTNDSNDSSDKEKLECCGCCCLGIFIVLLLYIIGL